MDIQETLCQIVIATLAVIGLYAVLHELAKAFLTPRELAVAVVIMRPISPEELDILLCEACRASLGRGRRVVLVLSRELWEGSEGYVEMTDKYGATVCFLNSAP